MLMQLLLLLLSIIILYFGAEFTLESSEKIGKKLNIPPLIIGLVIIGFGTSLPEFFVSQMASIKGDLPMAIGNIVGSNIANMFLILGVSGIFVNLTLNTKEIKYQLFFHLFITIILSLTLTFLGIGKISLLIYFFIFISYLFITYKSMNAHKANEDSSNLSFLDVVKLIIGFVFLFKGGELLVSSGSSVAKLLGISTYVISAIVIAFGTSFPELITAILAIVKKKDSQLIIGNIIGSNVFNIAFVLGSLGVYKYPSSYLYFFEISILLSGALFLIILSLLKLKFNKISAIMFLFLYFFSIYRIIG